MCASTRLRGGAGTVFATGLNNPHGAAFDGTGNLYVSSTGSNLIIKINSSGTTSTFSSSTLLNSPRFVAFAPAPEPSPRAALAVGVAGLSAMALTARRRHTTK